MDFVLISNLIFLSDYYFYKNTKLNVNGIYLFCIFSGKKIKICEVFQMRR